LFGAHQRRRRKEKKRRKSHGEFIAESRSPKVEIMAAVAIVLVGCWREHTGKLD
jgi:hypothetical protein